MTRYERWTAHIGVRARGVPMLVLLLVSCGITACGEVNLKEPDAASDPVVQIAPGHGVSCAVKASGAVLCWGANEFGQLGDAPVSAPTCSAFNRTAPCRATPTVVQGLTEVQSIAVGFHHACAVKREGTVWCWGLNNDGQLGHDPTLDERCSGLPCSATPTPVGGLANVAEVVTSANHSCARTKAGAVLCWGENTNGTLGNGAFGGSTHSPVPVNGMASDVTRIATAGFCHTTCAIKAGEVYCWGIAFTQGNLGHDPATAVACTSSSCAPTPVKVASIAGAFDLAVGERTVCAAISGGSIRCWGSNLFGQLGTSAAAPSTYAAQAVPEVTQVVSLAGSMTVTCARTQPGDLFCWGLAAEGGIGDGDRSGAACALAECRPSPTRVPLANPVALHATGSLAIAIDTTGALWSWGQNGFGELGHPPATGGDATCGTGTCAATPVSLSIP